MDHRVGALSISDIVKYWNAETNSDHKFEILYDIVNGILKFVDPFLEFECLDTERDIEEFISRNEKYGIYYFHSGEEFLGKYGHFQAISEVVLYGGPKTVEDLDLIMAMQQLCIRKDEFRRWIETSGKPLPRFWFKGVSLDASSPDQGQNAPSAAAAIDISSDLSRRERESLHKQIAALALVLAEKSAKYKNGDKPNANQIAEAVALMLDAMPDANTYGVSSASLRSSIKAGIAMLQGKREEVE